ncbi:PDDEXK family nuclease [Oryzicola mucosus]|uniref:Uncharacterized protein n=1 Tax=Oryzicola mucosus TaxID=2767425 RepID=A0A8J6U8W2_9HYPH|nr:hypothetical protein [Oryzicola mucosus]MBD0416247.1 hypothetical protein [Oryzicola mucosus]
MTNIFIIGPDNSLTELTRTAYSSEDLFQRLLADHPSLLRSASGPEGRLLLVQREQPVPDSDDNSRRWSLDHLFLDRQGVPVLVEVKQASDTRSRREVVAQMLDYAANGVAYWPIERLIEAFHRTATHAGLQPDSALSDFLDGTDPETFWRAVEANLKSGRVRMLFVADRIPKELARIVEFLNEQMRPAEVLAVEIEQFTSSTGVRTLVPKLVGQTERAILAKAVTEPKASISETEWLEMLAAKFGEPYRAGAMQIMSWFRQNGFVVGLTESQDSVFANVPQPDARPAWPFFIRRSSGRIETALSYLANTKAFTTEQSRQILIDKLHAMPTSTLRSTKKLTSWPSFEIKDILEPDFFESFTNIAKDIKEKIYS